MKATLVSSSSPPVVPPSADKPDGTGSTFRPSSSYLAFQTIDRLRHTHAYLFGARTMPPVASDLTPGPASPRESMSSERTMFVPASPPGGGNSPHPGPSFSTLLVAANDGQPHYGHDIVKEDEEAAEEGAKASKKVPQYRYSLADPSLPRDHREVIPIGRNTGIAGPDRASLVHELKRLRGAKSGRRRRRHAALAGGATLVVAGATLYMIIGDIISLIRLGAATASTPPERDHQRFGFLLANVSTRFVSFTGLLLALLLCRYARRPTGLSRSVFLFGILAFVLQVALSIINIMLILVWRSSNVPGRSVRWRCEWGVDLLWALGDAAKICPNQSAANGGDQMPWIVSGSVRLLVVLIAGTGWLHLLRLFIRSLSVASIIDPEAVPDGYIQQLLEKHSATIVDLNDTALVTRTAYIAGSEREFLPAMPERRMKGERSASGTGEGSAKRSKLREGSAQSWGGTVSGALSWLFGSSGTYVGVKERPGSIYSKASLEQGEKAGSLKGAGRYDAPEYDADEWILPDEAQEARLANKTADGSSSASWNPVALLKSWWYSPSPDATSKIGTEHATAEQSTPMLQQNVAFDPDPNAFAYESPFANNPLHPDYQPAVPHQRAHDPHSVLPPTAASFPSPPNTRAQSPYKALFNGIPSRSRYRTESGDSNVGDAPYRAESGSSSAPVTSPKPLPPAPTTPATLSVFTEHIDTSPPRPARTNQAAFHQQQQQEDLALRRDYDEYDEDSLVIDDEELGALTASGQVVPRPNQQQHRRNPSGSIVYIRMSDGRLVRKLSTIHSEREGSGTTLNSTPERLGASRSHLPGGWGGSH